MFERILLASDGSEHADRAAKKAISLVKEMPDATITILHVSTSAPKKGELLESGFDVKTVLLEKAYQSIHNTRSLFREAGVPLHLEVALGDPASEIIKWATEGKFGLIIVGSRGLTRLEEVLLGSVSHQVAHDAPCPVMIVK